MDQSLTSTSVHVQVARSLLAVNYVIAVNATLAIVNTAESWMQGSVLSPNEVDNEATKWRFIRHFNGRDAE